MFKVVLVIISGALFSATACGAKTEPGTDGGITCVAAGTKAFGEACADACDCSSLACHPFGDGSTLCTVTCSTNDGCPSGSQGKKCNAQGVCRP